MNFHELRIRLSEGMTTAVMNYGFDFQVDVVDGEEDFDDNSNARKSFMMDKIRHHRFDKHEHHWEKHEMAPWEIKNAFHAKERRENVMRWLKAASGNNLQTVNDKSLPEVPNWQNIKFKS
jgi:hypothetical protein